MRKVIMIYDTILTLVRTSGCAVQYIHLFSRKKKTLKLSKFGNYFSQFSVSYEFLDGVVISVKCFLQIFGPLRIATLNQLTFMVLPEMLSICFYSILFKGHILNLNWNFLRNYD